MSLESRSAVKRVFAAVIVLLALHYVFIWAYKEPYPTVTMPSFAGTGITADGESRWLAVTATVQFADDRTEELLPRTLLAEAPASHRLAMMRWAFSAPPVQREPPPLSSNAQLRMKVFPIERIRYERQYVLYTRPETRQWLERRLQALYPERTPRTITFIWYWDQARLVEGSMRRTEEVIAKYVVNLREEAQ